MGDRLQEVFINRPGASCDKLADPPRPPATSETRSGSRPRKVRRLKVALVVTDLAAVCLALTVAGYLYHYAPGEGAVSRPRTVELSLLSLPVWAMSFAHYRLYSARCISSRLFEFRRVVHAAGASVIVMAAISFIARLYVPRSWLVLAFVTSVVTLTVSRDLSRRAFDAQRRRGRLQRSVLVVGANLEGQEVATILGRTPASSYRVVGFMDDDLPVGAVIDGVPVLGAVSATASTASSNGVGGVLIATSAVGLQTTSKLAFELTAAGVHVELCAGLCDVAPERLTVERVGRLAVLYVEPVRLDGWRGGAKRLVDVVIAAVGLVAALPLLAAAAVAIRLNSRGPVLFRQKRVGQDGQLFEILKLRTMVDRAEELVIDLRDRNDADGPLFKLRDDPRVTRVGRTLRRLSIDEFPQLWNVVRGEMSLVGPRPALPEEIHGWSPELHERLLVRPGITGMWQVSGRTDASFEDYTRLDLYYVHNWSLLTDLAMLAKTVPTVLSRRGAC